MHFLIALVASFTFNLFFRNKYWHMIRGETWYGKAPCIWSSGILLRRTEVWKNMRYIRWYNSLMRIVTILSASYPETSWCSSSWPTWTFTCSAKYRESVGFRLTPCLFELAHDVISLICSRYIKVGSRFHLELIHGGTGFGDVELVVVLAGHIVFSFSQPV